LEDIKGRDIEVINTAKLTSLFDRIIIASADSTRQTKALARNVHDKVKEAGGEVTGMEGEETGEWVLVDLGDIVVHVMQPNVRQHYDLESLWKVQPKRVTPKAAVEKSPRAAPAKAAPTKVAPAKAVPQRKRTAKAAPSPEEAPPAAAPRRRTRTATPKATAAEGSGRKK
jgi:ribosome-associated protein